jgi:hypothetical protein
MHFYGMQITEDYSFALSRFNNEINPMGLLRGEEVYYGIGNLARPYCFWLWDSCFNTKGRGDKVQSNRSSAHIILDKKAIFMQTSILEDGSSLLRMTFKQNLFSYGAAASSKNFYGIFKYHQGPMKASIAANQSSFELIAEYVKSKNRFDFDLRTIQEKVFSKASYRNQRMQISGLYFANDNNVLWANYLLENSKILIFSESLQGANLHFGKSIQNGPFDFRIQSGFSSQSILSGIGIRYYRISHDCIYFFNKSKRKTNLAFLLWDSLPQIELISWKFLAKNVYSRLAYTSPDFNISIIVGEKMRYFIMNFRYQAV